MPFLIPIIFLFALGHGRLRGHSVVNVRLYYRVRLKTAVLRHVYHCKRHRYSAVYDTAWYDRNTVPTKRVIYGPFTIVNVSFTAVYVVVNDCLRSFTIVVLMDMGKRRENILKSVADFFDPPPSLGLKARYAPAFNVQLVDTWSHQRNQDTQHRILLRFELNQ